MMNTERGTVTTQHRKTRNASVTEQHRRAAALGNMVDPEAESSCHTVPEAEAERGSHNLIPQNAGDLQHAGVEDLLAILRAEGKKRNRRIWLTYGVGVGASVPLFVIGKLTHQPFFSLGPLCCAVSGLIIVLTANAMSRRGQAAAMALARFNDVRVVGPLAEALKVRDEHVVRIVTESLIRLLPQLQVSDAFLLNQRQRNCLEVALQGKNEALTLAILKAWEQVGDSDAIAEVEFLAEGRGMLGWRPEVVAAARECLPFLRQSVERRQSGLELLRAADGTVISSDILLRPVRPQHISTDSSEQLLRPIDPS
jgi:hypothetical protein